MQVYQNTDDEAAGGEARWLLLIHQIPPKPNYFRVKVWRRLQTLGAVAIKNSVYVLPRSEQTLEDFQWLQKEIEEGGGEASVCEARFVDGLTDEQVQALFNAARDSDYGQLADEARALLESAPADAALDENRRSEVSAQLRRLKKRFAQIANLDFFHAPGREAAEGLLSGVEQRLLPSDTGTDETAGPLSTSAYVGRTWVTRRGVHVDRMASAWLIRRFIDPEARFKFVPGRGYEPQPGELRFDMFEAEFTHEGDRCTFEVLLSRFGLEDPGLLSIAEIVHDIDLKDRKFQREDAAGVAEVIAGIAMEHRDDDERLVRGTMLFDALYRYFKTKRKS